MSERLGIFGGTFDPPHVGHLVTAVNVRHDLGLDRVLLVVAGRPWQKLGTRELSSAADRYAMVAAAVGTVDGLEASALEIDRQGPDHAPRFTAEVRIKGRKPARGEGASKRAAEQAAASALLGREGVWKRGADV